MNVVQTSASTASFTLQQCSNPVIEEIFRTCTIRQRDGSTKPLDVYIPPEQGDYLYSLVRHRKPNITLEVGMANGLSSLFITQALSENGFGRHIAIDPFQGSDWGYAGMAALQRSGLESLVELFEKPSHQALPELEQLGVVPQFIFVDGSHLFDYVMTDFLCGDRLLDLDGVMAFDDADWPAVNQVLRFALLNRKYRLLYPHIVIEPLPHTPTRLARLVRQLGTWLPMLGEKLRPDFLSTSYDLGIRGRCVVIQKLDADDRDSQANGPIQW